MDDRDLEDFERDPRQVPSFRGPPDRLRPQSRPLAQATPFSPAPRVRAAQAESPPPSPRSMPRRKRRRVARALAVLVGLSAGAALIGIYAMAEDWRALEPQDLHQAWRAPAENAGSVAPPSGEDKIEQPSAPALSPVAAAPVPARQAGPSTPSRAPPVASAISPDLAAFALARGDALMRLRDVASARRFYELAASGGLPEAARAVAQTYDPRYLQRLGVAGFPGDPGEAARWYDRAAELAEQSSTPVPATGSTTEASPR